MGFTLLINVVHWGYNPLTNHLLTSWDIKEGGSWPQISTHGPGPQNHLSFEKNSFYFLLHLATYLRENFRVAFATTVLTFAEHMGKQELSQPFRRESGGVYLRPKGAFLCSL